MGCSSARNPHPDVVLVVALRYGTIAETRRGGPDSEVVCGLVPIALCVCEELDRAESLSLSLSHSLFLSRPPASPARPSQRLSQRAAFNNVNLSCLGL
jgi:hypothetical protein